MEYQVGEIFYIDENYSARAEYCNKHNLMIKEIEPDERGRRFIIANLPEPTSEEKTYIKITNLKDELEKYKEDVEQVELFGMSRDDYELKKSRCREIILELRLLENQLGVKNG